MIYWEKDFFCTKFISLFFFNRKTMKVILLDEVISELKKKKFETNIFIYLFLVVGPAENFLPEIN